jgi:hypothetical protein
MSFHRRRIPGINRLKEIYEECATDKEFLDRVIGRVEAISGSSESMKFLATIQNKVFPETLCSEDFADYDSQ